MVRDVFDRAGDLWLTAEEIFEELPEFRSRTAVRRVLKTMTEERRVEIGVREARYFPLQYRNRQGRKGQS